MRGASGRASLKALSDHIPFIRFESPHRLNAVYGVNGFLFNDDPGFAPLDIGIFNGDFVIGDLEMLMQQTNAEPG